MYMGYSSVACVYTCYIVGKARTCGKNVFFSYGFEKRDEKSAWGNGKGPLCKIAWVETKIAIIGILSLLFSLSTL
jgi:hypothetical protein